MKKLMRPLALGTVLLSFALSSCVDPYYGGGYGGGYGPGGYGRPPAHGAVAGGLLGAAAGGIIGNQSRRGLEGAAIGGLLGALAGSVMSAGQQGYQQQPDYSYGPQNGYPPNDNYGQPSSYYPDDNGYDEQPVMNSSNPYAFGNWQ